MKIEELGDRIYPVAMVNVTNRCNLRCKACFIYRDGNPSPRPRSRSEEMDSATMLRTIRELRDRHQIRAMVWMGGEPLLRRDVLVEGVQLFPENTIVTNGTLDLVDLGRCVYVVSLDGPEQYNDELRGPGSFGRIMRTLRRVAEQSTFEPTVQVQCCVSRENEDQIEALLNIVIDTRAEGLSFTFYVPSRDDRSPLAWRSLQEREPAVRCVMALKQRYPHFVWNSMRSLELMLPENAPAVTGACLPKKFLLPLYLNGYAFEVPFCCAGNNVDCELCGMWGVFHMAAKLEGGAPSRYIPDGSFSTI